MKLVKKITVVIIVCLMMVNNTFAYSYTSSHLTSAGKQFSKAWQITREVSWVYSGITVGTILAYGYDTWLIDEDYVKNVGGQPTTWAVEETVYNSKGAKQVDGVY